MSRPSPATTVVYQAISDLANSESAARRKKIQQRTGLPTTIMDEAIRRLKEDEMTVKMVKPGHFVPVRVYDEEACSATVLDDGRCKIEKGDSLITLTPREAAAFLGLLVGYSLMNSGAA